MTASYKFLINSGTVVADTSDLKSDIETEFKTALGSSLDVAASTPQGTLIAAETIARTSVMNNNADLANLINPDLSYGVFLDAICALLGEDRGSDSSTKIVDALLEGDGVRTVTIPQGSRVKTSGGDIFLLQDDVTITDGGDARGTFVSQGYGDITVEEQTLTIIDGAIGWNSASVDNASTIIEGTTQLKDSQLKIARNNQLAIQGVGSSEAIVAEVSKVANVTSVIVVENNTGQHATAVNGVTFTLDNAIWVCVSGTPNKADVAAALYKAHQGGCPWDYGSSGEGVQVDAPDGTQVTSPSTGFKYSVKWTTPVLLDVYVDITVKQTTSVSSPVPSIQSAIVNYANGSEDGEEGLVVGQNISAFEMAGAVARQIPGMYIKSCSVAVVAKGGATPAASDYVSEFTVNPWQQGVVSSNRINVTVVS